MGQKTDLLGACSVVEGKRVTRDGLTVSERILLSHGQTGYEAPSGARVVLSLWSMPDGSIGEEWETLPAVPDDMVGSDEDPLMHWLGY